MSEHSPIHWTDATWNPVTGCSRVSDGCRNCYAEALSLRYGWSKKPWTHVNAPENVVLRPERLEAPLHWRKPKMIFVNSMSDLFHEQVDGGYITRVFEIMRLAKQHTFQVLTKRPERMADFCRTYYARSPEPLPNVWLGTSVESQREADQRIPQLINAAAAVRFLSCEPLLGPLDLQRYLQPWIRFTGDEDFPRYLHYDLHWVICGGESGPNHRPMDLDWARSLRDQCLNAGVAFFYKQGSGRYPGMQRELDGQKWEQYPGKREAVTA